MPRFHAILEADLCFEAPPQEVLPLLCPVREAAWLPGWKAEILHSHSGLAELGCVFRTTDPDGTPRIWTLSRLEPGELQFVQFVPDHAVIRLDIGLRAGEGGTTRAAWRYEVAALDPGPDPWFESYAPAPFQARMDRLAHCLNAHLASRGQAG